MTFSRLVKLANTRSWLGGSFVTFFFPVTLAAWLTWLVQLRRKEVFASPLSWLLMAGLVRRWCGGPTSLLSSLLVLLLFGLSGVDVIASPTFLAVLAMAGPLRRYGRFASLSFRLPVSLAGPARRLWPSALLLFWLLVIQMRGDKPAIYAPSELPSSRWEVYIRPQDLCTFALTIYVALLIRWEYLCTSRWELSCNAQPPEVMKSNTYKND